ncbi:YraN family protein [bacterium]|nr:YraN family protein [candidate division CSSED10-310 bacterium]
MTRERKSIGYLGEGFARGFLKRQGFNIIQSPYRCRYGEIDIIAMEDDILVFVEVKTRRTLRYGSPLEAVDRIKQKTIIKIARHYLMNCKIKFINCRFDVIAITQIKQNAPPDIHHIRDAFRDDSGW